MPAAYAHYTFGSKCINTLPDTIREACVSNRDIFNLGVHGPDILFYYRFVTPNNINDYGSKLHEKSGRSFFENARDVYEQNPEDPATLSYIFGFLAHFAMDSVCHAYVWELDKTTPYSHNFIESCFESHLMRKAGFEPTRFDRRIILHPTKAAAKTIAAFFPFSESEINEALVGQVQAMGLLYSPNGLKKRGLTWFVEHLPVSDDFADLFLSNKTPKDLVEPLLHLDELAKEALALYPTLAENLWKYLHHEEDLNDHFDMNFEGELKKSVS